VWQVGGLVKASEDEAGTDLGADHRKLKSRLLTSWPTIPIEVAPLAARQVVGELRKLGSPQPFIREGNSFSRHYLV
jgi:ribose 5-phosphate isomerase